MRILYRRVLDDLDAVVDAFPSERWEQATPCTAWTARMLVGHVVDGQRQVAAMLAGHPRPPVDDADELARIAGSDPAVSWRAARREVVAALDAVPDDALVPTPMGEQTVEALLGTAIVEPLVHSWDLAVAAGAPTELDAEAVRSVLATLEHLGDALVASGMYAPARPVVDGMDDQDRVLALTGRTTVPAEWRGGRAVVR